VDVRFSEAAVVARRALSHSPSRRSSLVHDVTAGGICSVLSVAYALTYAALIFSGPLASALDLGVTVSLVSTALLAAVIAVGSSIPFMVGGPDSSTSAVVGVTTATLAERLLAQTPSAELLPLTLLALAVLSVATGAFLLAIGFLRGGRAIRYVPYPVIGGFLGATGWLIITGAVRVITGHRLELAPDALAQLATTPAMLAGIGFAAAIWLALRFANRPATLPLLLLGGILAAHAGFALAGLSLDEAQAAGWTFATPAAGGGWSWAWTVTLPSPEHIPAQFFGDAAAVVLVTAITTLVNTTGVEVATVREADIDRELKVTGLANLASAAAGGIVGCASISRTILNRTAGGRGRLSGLTVAAVAAALAVSDPSLLHYLPKFVLGGLLLFLGVSQLHQWLIASWRRLSFIEYCSLVAIIVIAAQLGFIWGIVIGTVIGCATFAVSAARVNAIKFEFDGSELRSSLDRAAVDLAVLSRHGREILGINLQSYLFFGSANRLYRHVKARLAARPECRFLLFDFRLVTGLDSSATHSFMQIRQQAAERGIQLIFVHLSAKAEKALRAERALTRDVMIVDELDHALEWCEAEVLRRHQATPAQDSDLRGWFAGMLGGDAAADELVRRCRRIELAPGTVIAEAGAAANSMYFILEGRIAVLVPTPDDRTIRVRSLGRHTIVGEMGLLAGQPRSARLQAEIDSVLYELDRAGFDALKAERPQLAERLLGHVVAVLAERLAFANRAIGVLRR
jgi:SulP family sulfate permease